MTRAPRLLDDDGKSSMATAFMMSHHGFRRDLALYEAALARVAAGGPAAAASASRLDDEWTAFTHKLHGHHDVEDKHIFPWLRAQHARLATTLDRLEADHRRIGPLLEQGKKAFGDLPGAVAVARSTSS